MNFEETVSYIESLVPRKFEAGLERFALFMAENGKWQDAFPSLHIGGTNGKGSTVAMIESILRHAGLKTGRFTGPHLLNWNERFHIAGEPISNDNFAKAAT